MISRDRKLILIIDDDETIKEALNLLLEDEGYDTDHLASGSNLDNWLQINRADLILIDYLMPGETGAEITKRLRLRDDTKNTPIIMLAATRHYDKIAYLAGVDKFMDKPFEIDDLLRQVRYYLSD